MNLDITHCQELLTIVYSKSQSEDLKKQLYDLSESLFSSNEPTLDIMTRMLSHDYKEKLLILIEKNGVETVNKDQFRDFLKSLISVIESLEVLTVGLPFVPKDNLVKDLSDWVLGNTNRKVLLNFIIDESLIAGASLSFRGVYKELSVKQMLFDKYKDTRLIELIKTK